MDSGDFSEEDSELENQISSLSKEVGDVLTRLEQLQHTEPAAEQQDARDDSKSRRLKIALRRLESYTESDWRKFGIRTPKLDVSVVRELQARFKRSAHKKQESLSNGEKTKNTSTPRDQKGPSVEREKKKRASGRKKPQIVENLTHSSPESSFMVLESISTAGKTSTERPGRLEDDAVTSNKDTSDCATDRDSGYAGSPQKRKRRTDRKKSKSSGRKRARAGRRKVTPENSDEEMEATSKDELQNERDLDADSSSGEMEPLSLELDESREEKNIADDLFDSVKPSTSSSTTGDVTKEPREEESVDDDLFGRAKSSTPSHTTNDVTPDDRWDSIYNQTPDDRWNAILSQSKPKPCPEAPTTKPASKTELKQKEIESLDKDDKQDEVVFSYNFFGQSPKVPNKSAGPKSKKARGRSTHEGGNLPETKSVEKDRNVKIDEDGSVLAKIQPLLSPEKKVTVVLKKIKPKKKTKATVAAPELHSTVQAPLRPSKKKKLKQKRLFTAGNLRDGPYIAPEDEDDEEVTAASKETPVADKSREISRESKRNTDTVDYRKMAAISDDEFLLRNPLKRKSPVEIAAITASTEGLRISGEEKDIARKTIKENNTTKTVISDLDTNKQDPMAQKLGHHIKNNSENNEMITQAIGEKGKELSGLDKVKEESNSAEVETTKYATINDATADVVTSGKELSDSNDVTDEGTDQTSHLVITNVCSIKDVEAEDTDAKNEIKLDMDVPNHDDATDRTDMENEIGTQQSKEIGKNRQLEQTDDKTNNTEEETNTEDLQSFFFEIVNVPDELQEDKEQTKKTDIPPVVDNDADSSDHQNNEREHSIASENSANDSDRPGAEEKKKSVTESDLRGDTTAKPNTEGVDPDTKASTDHNEIANPESASTETKSDQAVDNPEPAPTVTTSAGRDDDSDSDGGSLIGDDIDFVFNPENSNSVKSAADDEERGTHDKREGEEVPGLRENTPLDSSFTPTLDENALSFVPSQPPLPEGAEDNNKEETEASKDEDHMVLILQPKLLGNKEKEKTWVASLQFTPTQDGVPVPEVDLPVSDTTEKPVEKGKFDFGEPSLIDESLDETLDLHIGEEPMVTPTAEPQTNSSSPPDAQSQLVTMDTDAGKENPKGDSVESESQDETLAPLHFNNHADLPVYKGDESLEANSPTQAESSLRNVESQSQSILTRFTSTSAQKTGQDDKPNERGCAGIVQPKPQDASKVPMATTLPPFNTAPTESDATSVVSATTANTSFVGQMGRGAFGVWNPDRDSLTKTIDERLQPGDSKKVQLEHWIKNLPDEKADRLTGQVSAQTQVQQSLDSPETPEKPTDEKKPSTSRRALFPAEEQLKEEGFIDVLQELDDLKAEDGDDTDLAQPLTNEQPSELEKQIDELKDNILDLENTILDKKEDLEQINKAITEAEQELSVYKWKHLEHKSRRMKKEIERRKEQTRKFERKIQSTKSHLESFRREANNQQKKMEKETKDMERRIEVLKFQQKHISAKIEDEKKNGTPLTPSTKGGASTIPIDAENVIDIMDTIFLPRIIAKRANNPTCKEMIRKYDCPNRSERRHETKKTLEMIHGGPMGSLYGAVDFLLAHGTPELVKELTSRFKRLKQITTPDDKSRQDKEEAANISNLYLQFQRNRKFKFLCRIQKVVFELKQDVNIKRMTQLARHKLREGHSISIERSDEIASVLPQFLGPVFQIPNSLGVSRTVTSLSLMIADLYIGVPHLQSQIQWFKDEPYHFVLQFSDDGGTEDKAQGLSMSVGVMTLWNLGRQWRDPEAGFILHGLTVQEKERIPLMTDIWTQHTDEMAVIEGSVFTVHGKKVTFSFEPSADMAWQLWASNETNQNPKYPSMYANVSTSSMPTVNGSVGFNTYDTWRPISHDERLLNLKKLSEFSKSLNKDLTGAEKKIRRREFMTTTGVRQMGLPRIGKYAEKLRPEPRQCEVAAWLNMLEIVAKEACKRNNMMSLISVLSAPEGAQTSCPPDEEDDDLSHLRAPPPPPENNNPGSDNEDQESRPPSRSCTPLLGNLSGKSPGTMFKTNSFNDDASSISGLSGSQTPIAGLDDFDDCSSEFPDDRSHTPTSSKPGRLGMTYGSPRCLPIKAGIAGCGLPQIAKDVYDHFTSVDVCASGKYLRLPLTVKDIAAICRNWHLICESLMDKKLESDKEKVRRIAIFKMGDSLRQAGPYFYQMTSDDASLEKVRALMQVYFNLHVLFLGPSFVNLTVWTVAHAILYHMRQLHEKYRVGYGVVMSRPKHLEALGIRGDIELIKDVQPSNLGRGKWWQMARVNFLRCFYIPEHENIAFTDDETTKYYQAGARMSRCNDKNGTCPMCDHEFMTYVTHSAVNGRVSPNLSDLVEYLSKKE